MDGEKLQNVVALAVISEETINISRSLKRILLALSEHKKYDMKISDNDLNNVTCCVCMNMFVCVCMCVRVYVC